MVAISTESFFSTFCGARKKLTEYSKQCERTQELYSITRARLDDCLRLSRNLEVPLQAEADDAGGLDCQWHTLRECRAGEIGFQCGFLQIEKVEGVKLRQNAPALYRKRPRDPQIQGGVKLGPKSAKVSTRRCSHKERSLVESVYKQQPAKRQAVIVFRHDSEPNAVR